MQILETDRTALSIEGAALANLSFTGSRPEGKIDLWAPDRGDELDWGKQCSLGREFAAEACDHIRDTGNVPLIPGIVRTIAERGRFGGVEVGFFSELSEQLMR